LRFYVLRAVSNYIIDRKRKAGAAQRRFERERIRAQEEKEWNELKAAGISELRKIVAELAAEARPVQQESLGLVYHIYAMDMSSKDMVEIFPNLSMDSIYQRKRRGLKLIWPHASDTLKEFLRRGGGSRTHIKSDENLADSTMGYKIEANMKKIFKVAELFKRADWVADVKQTVIRTIDQNKPNPNDPVPTAAAIRVMFQPVEGNFPDKVMVWAPNSELEGAAHGRVMENAIISALERLFYDDDLGRSAYHIELVWT
jgi:hypothetical protein